MPDANSVLPGAGLHDIIVIGASAGGLQPLEALLAGLPRDLPAAVLVVLHLGATSHLAEILGRLSALPVWSATNGAKIEPGSVVVATPGCHLLVHHDHILLRRGPRENLLRPAIDPLFRSVACTFGPRVIGLILSGALNDGSAGLRAIKRCGGIAVVQDPRDAAVQGMPLSALRHAEVDHVAVASELGPLLARLVHTPPGPACPVPLQIRIETAIAAQELAGMEANDELGKPSRFTCPECHGALWEVDDGSLLRYRCHVGHAYTADVMLDAQTESAEELLWSLMRSHQERAALARRMEAKEREQSNTESADGLMRRALGYDEDAATIARLLKDHFASTDTPASAAAMG